MADEPPGRDTHPAVPRAKWLWLTLAAVLLTYGTIMVFLAFDRSSHSNSDTLRPFIITMAPVWVIGILGAKSWLRR